MKQIAFFTFVIASISIAAACGGAANNTTTGGSNNVNVVKATPMPSATIDEFASGRKVYSDNCAGCHKDNGTGGEISIEGKKINADDLTSAKIKGFSDEKILGYIMNGVPDEGMPAFKGKLSEGEMRDVVVYVRRELQKMPAPTAAN